MIDRAGIPALLVLTLSLVPILQTKCSCREETPVRVVIASDALLHQEGTETGSHQQQQISGILDYNATEALFLRECNSEEDCMQKCCETGSTLDPKAIRCIREGTPGNASAVNGSSDALCFGECISGKMLVVSSLNDAKSSSLRKANGKFCLPHKNLSSCFTSDEFCIDRAPSGGGLIVAACRKASNKPTWKGYSYPSPVMPVMIGVMLIISSLSLTVTFLIYAYFRELRNLHGKCLLCHMGSLILYYVVIIVRRFRTAEMRHNGASCFALDVTRYYFYLAPFSWLNVTCFDISMSFIYLTPTHGNFRRMERSKFTLFSVYSWVTPALAFFVSLDIDLEKKGLDFSDIDIKEWCTAKRLSSSMYRYIPMSLFMGFSAALFVMTAIKIYKINRSTSILREGGNTRRQSRSDKNKEIRFKMYAKLLIVMGFMSWVMEPIFWAVHEWMVKDRNDYKSTVWFVMLVIRNLQGLYISVVFLWTKRVRSLLLKKLKPVAATSSSRSRSYELSNKSHSESSKL